MKIALVHRRFTTNGGTERYLVGFARFLVARGHDVSVLCHEIREDLRSEPGLRFVHLRMVRAAKLASLWWSASRAIRAGNYDAVMGFGRTGGHHLFRAGGGSHADYLRRAHPVRRLVNPDDWFETAVDRAAVRAARIVMANSRLGAQGLARDYAPRRVEVVYNGVDGQRFRPDAQVRAATREELGDHGKVAIFLGNGFVRKGLATAIAALPDEWSLWVIGGDPPIAAPPRVRFLGPQRDPERFLQAADAMILPTRYDPFANACLEAMACGVPAITTSANGASEVLPEPWLVADSVGDCARALVRVGSARGLGDACRAVAERLSPQASYTRALELLVEASR
ncbi:MAG: glycosyltransferase family 4 protein [Deltaproteobacteria bacterium]|nr:glycosyltransferase family 4 protein [Deltaproteobacteria bacterium]